MLTVVVARKEQKFRRNELAPSGLMSVSQRTAALKNLYLS